MKAVGLFFIVVWIAAAAGAPWIAPHGPTEQFRSFLFARPMLPHVVDDGGRWHLPFVYPQRLVDQLEQRYEEDRTRPLPLAFLSGGKLVRAAGEEGGPWLPLGADSFGRDEFARLLYGARTSLSVALVAVLGALLIGTIVGGLSGYIGGVVDDALMRLSDLILVLPSIYHLLALRTLMPLVLPSSTVFLMMSGILALVGWPYVARGVRAIVAAERGRDYVAAAVSLGAGHRRVLFRHLLPASAGFVATQATLLLPAFVLAEATLSFVGVGFPDPTPSWGAMLHEAANVAVIADFPWALSPAAAIFTVVLALNLLVQGSGRDPVSALFLVSGRGMRSILAGRRTRPGAPAFPDQPPSRGGAPEV
jgi:peptide/nickel transport system permease protein